jgi:hypothetical protein
MAPWGKGAARGGRKSHSPRAISGTRRNLTPVRFFVNLEKNSIEGLRKGCRAHDHNFSKVAGLPETLAFLRAEERIHENNKISAGPSFDDQFLIGHTFGIFLALAAF